LIISGTKINPWYIQTLIEAVRSVSFSNYADDKSPPCSTLDFHNILENYFIFIVGVTMDIKRPFHDFETPKAPLYVVEKLKYLGKTSKTLTYDIRHGNTDELYVSCDITDVLVSTKSRKPTAYPDWWFQKHGDLVTEEKAKFAEEGLPNNEPFSSVISVKSSDIDTYQHTNWASYLKFCYESFTDHTLTNSYKRMNNLHLSNGLKSCSMIYKNETNLGDTLNVKSWESDADENKVIFNVLKDNKVCLYCNMEFFNTFE
jgi:acyl-CoA thioesterase FadM